MMEVWNAISEPSDSLGVCGDDDAAYSNSNKGRSKVQYKLCKYNMALLLAWRCNGRKL